MKTRGVIYFSQKCVVEQLTYSRSVRNKRLVAKTIYMDRWRREKFCFYVVFVSILFLLFADKGYSQNSISDSLIRKFEQLSDDKLRLKTALEIVNLNVNSDSVLYLRYAEKSLLLSEKLGEKIKEGRICIALGYFYSERNLLKALEYGNRGLKVYSDLDSLDYKSQAYTLIGSIYYYSGNYSKSFENYFESLKINERLKNEMALATDYNNLAVIYFAQKNNKKALDYYFKALAINKKYDLVEEYSGNLINISTTYGEIDSLDQEFKYGSMALDSARKYNEDLLFPILLSYGDICVKKKDFAKAEKYYAEAEELITKQGSKLYLYNLYYSKGELFKEKNDVGSAIYYYKLSLENAQKDGILPLVQDAGLELSKIYKSQNRFKESLHYYEIYHEVFDSISSIEKAKKITELELQYKFDKKIDIEKKKERRQHKVVAFQRMIITFSSIALILSIALVILKVRSSKSQKQSYILLSEKNAQILKQNDAILNQSNELLTQRDQLKHLNATKDKIYSIIAHDLKNPFNVILGFTSLVTEKWENIDDERKRLYISKVHESATNAYELLENLLDWARSQTGRINVEPECIEIKNHIDKTISYVIGHARSKGITISNLVEPSASIKVDVNMIGAVIRNLLSNAIKFTNENGIVKITNQFQANGDVSIVIEDNGVGMNEDVLASLFNFETHVSTKGTKNEKGTGLGLLICKEFVEKNNGKIDVESEVGKGTRFIITLPVCNEGTFTC